MNSTAFLLAAIGFIIMAVFVYSQYPKQWRENRAFITVLILCHLVGLSAVVVIFTVFRNIYHENIRYEISRIGSFYYITTFIQAILFFVRGISCRTFLFISDRTGMPVSKLGKRLISNKVLHSVIIVVLSFTTFIVGYFNIDFLQDTRYEVAVAADSQEKELNICLIADIHAGSGTWEYTYDHLVDQIDQSAPDVLFIAGDVFDETTGSSDVDNFVWALNEIKRPKYGIWFVYGNHDGLEEDKLQRLRDAGVTILQDEMAVIGEDIQLIGCLDPAYRAMEFGELFEKCAPDRDKPIIVLTHRPKHFRQLADLGCDLVMAGHTHGFNIPQFLGAPLFGDMFSGIQQYGGMAAVTTSGVSAWGFHYKWPAVSEVVTIHVTFGGGAE